MINKEIRNIELEKFYLEKGMDKTLILKQNETEEDANDGYKCVCTYCLSNSRTCPHSCCVDGKPCPQYKDNQKEINKDKLIKGDEVK